VPGFEILAAFLLKFPAEFVWRITYGQFVLEWVREFGLLLLLMLISVSFLLPFISALLHFWRGESRRLRIFYQGSLGLVACLCLLIVVLNPAMRSGFFWGFWVYFAAAVCALIVGGITTLVKPGPAGTALTPGAQS
jgi:hypothetical protein